MHVKKTQKRIEEEGNWSDNFQDQTSSALSENNVDCAHTTVSFALSASFQLRTIFPIHPSSQTTSPQSRNLIVFAFKSFSVQARSLNAARFLRAHQQKKRKVKGNKLLILPRTPLHYAPLRRRNDGALCALILLLFSLSHRTKSSSRDKL